MKNIIHIIVGLNNGGAEMMLYKLIKYTDKSKYNIEVISLTDNGIMGKRIEDIGMKVHSLGITKGKIKLSGIKKAKLLCKDADVIQTWMYHADFFGYIVYRLLKRRKKELKLIWGIRHSNFNLKYDSKLTFLIMKFNALCSKNVDYIVSNSKNAKEVHIKYGYTRHNLSVIPNGFELDNYKKMSNSRKYIANLIDYPLEDTIILLRAARWHAMKDYTTLITAFGKVAKSYKNIILILCGSNINYSNLELVEMLQTNNVEKNVFLLDRRDDLNLLMSGSDIYISSSSSGEGFPNVIGEAMACQTTCIVTDVGDSAFIVGDTGVIIEKENDDILAKGILNLIEENNRNQLGERARERVLNDFDILNVVKKFENLYI